MNAGSSTAQFPTRLSWTAIQGVYADDLTEHQRRAQALGLDCPAEVFEQLFHDAHQDGKLAEVLRFVDWNTVTWEEDELSGVALRRVGVPRDYQRAVDEARARTAGEGFHDERPEVMVHWMQAHTWMRSPIVVAGDVLQSLLEYELLAGFTRLGKLLGALDRQDLPEYIRHRAWIGQTRGTRG